MMHLTRNERIKKAKQFRCYQQLKSIHKKMTLSAAVISGTSILGTYPIVGQNIVWANPAIQKKAYTKNAFLNELIPAAKEVIKDKNLYASVMLAQAALETGWGNSTLSKAPNYNLFGIKGKYQGKSVDMKTLEDSGNQNYYQITAEFRKYPSYKESLEDYTQVLLNGPSFDHKYYAGAWKSNTKSYKDATAHLTGRYATDSAYGQKLNKIIEQYDLTRFDEADTQKETASVSNSQSLDKYTVEKGDNLYAIARKTGSDIRKIFELNGLSEKSTIYPGQVIQLPNVSSTALAGMSAYSPLVRVDSASIKKEKRVQTDEYEIVSGDTLYRIALTHQISLFDLLQANQLAEDAIIYPGQKLTIPKMKDSTKNEVVREGTNSLDNSLNTGSQAIESEYKKTNQNSLPIPNEELEYVVKPGDGLWRIAKNHGLTLEELKSLNGLTSNLIHPGQVLKLQ